MFWGVSRGWSWRTGRGKERGFHVKPLIHTKVKVCASYDFDLVNMGKFAGSRVECFIQKESIPLDK